MYKLTAAVLAAVLVLTLAVPAFAAHDPNATGCERAHECLPVRHGRCLTGRHIPAYTHGTWLPDTRTRLAHTGLWRFVKTTGAITTWPPTVHGIGSVAEG